MSDLISRKETYNELIESIDWLRERDYELYCVIGDSIRVCLDEQPTAYDPEKVMEQLEELKSLVPVNRILDDIVNEKPKELGMLIAYRKAIEIVKAGVKNE